MKFGNLKQDKGVAGTSVLLGLIVSLFVIGLLVMIFALMGGSLKSNSSVAASETGSTTQVNLNASEGVTLTACNGATEGTISAISTVYDQGSNVLLGVGNYTSAGCTLTYVTGSSAYNGTLWNATYSYTYAGTAYDVINDTTGSIASVTTFFSLFIVIGSMVVLILLTVIIIVAIRQSGMLDSATA